jgi:quinol-cytochrome oxidoreductase complex cytochrome b subunit
MRAWERLLDRAGVENSHDRLFLTGLVVVFVAAMAVSLVVAAFSPSTGLSIFATAAVYLAVLVVLVIWAARSDR